MENSSLDNPWKCGLPAPCWYSRLRYSIQTSIYPILIETPDSRFRQTANESVNLYHVTKFSPLLLFTVH